MKDRNFTHKKLDANKRRPLNTKVAQTALISHINNWASRNSLSVKIHIS